MKTSGHLKLSPRARASLCALLALVPAAGGLRAADIYVSPDVGAFAGMGTADSPFGMIQAGIAKAWTNTEPTTVHLAAGIYSGQHIGGEGGAYPGGIGWDGLGMLFIENMDGAIGPRGAGRITVRGEGAYCTNTILSTQDSTVPRVAGSYYNCGFIRGNDNKYNNITFENLTLAFVKELWGYGIAGNASSTFANPATPLIFNRCAIVFGPNRGVVSGNTAPASSGVVKFRNSNILLGNADNRILFQWDGTTAAAGFADGQNSSLIWNTAMGLVNPANLLFMERLNKNGDDPIGATAYNVNGGFTNFNYALPTMAVFGTNGYEIVAGDVTPSDLDGTDFGSQQWGGVRVTHAFVIENYGSSNLVLDGEPTVSVTGAGESCFEVSGQPALTNIPPGVTAAFEIQFRPWGAEEKNATVVIPNNSGNPAEFTFDLHAVSIGFSGTVMVVE